MFLALMFLSFNVSAETWYGYCHTDKGNSTYCSGVKLRTADFDNYCKAFATSLGTYEWKMQYSTSVNWLQDKQSGMCNKIISGPASDEHDCYAITLCQNGGQPTSSISPIGFKVIAANKAEGLKQCLQQAKDIYYDIFAKNSKANCSTTASY
jgi:hypothetical protein